MSLVRALTEKPWLTPGLDAADAQRPADTRAAALTGLRLYFGVASVMFLLIAAAYLMHRGVGHDMPMEHGAQRGSLPPLPLLWFNTAILALDSLAWQRARRIAAGRPERLRPVLLGAGGLAILFLAGQAVAWWQLRPLASASTVTFFYLVSALHGLHLLGGLVAWGRTLAGLSPDADTARIETRVRLCADYWHFLLLVWLVMFALLLSG